MLEPKEVRRLAADLREAGFDPLVAGTPGGSWEVAVEGEHVRATAGYAFRNGRTRRVDGTLTVDGEPRPLADDIDDLRRVWDENEGAAPGPGEPAPAVLAEVADQGDAPAPWVVRSTAAGIERAMAGRLEGAVRTGMAGDRWAVGLDLGDGDGLRVFYRRRGRSWVPDASQPLQVVAGGLDRSAEAGGRLEEAVALLARTEPPQAGEAPPGGSAVRQQASRRDLGVETRHRVVIRELA